MVPGWGRDQGLPWEKDGQGLMAEEHLAEFLWADRGAEEGADRLAHFLRDAEEEERRGAALQDEAAVEVEYDPVLNTETGGSAR